MATTTPPTVVYDMNIASDALFINNLFTINQNVDVYGLHALQRNFDYIFRINVANLQTEGTTSGITSLFANATFIENSQNVEDYNVNLTLLDQNNFVNWATLFNNKAMVTVTQGLSSTNFGTFYAGNKEKIGDRLLEVVAHKLFGHAQARAAIKNDIEFYSHDGALWDHLSSSLATDSFKKDIFRQYVKLGRYNTFDAHGANVNGTDYNTHVAFNFENITLDFPLQLSGNMLFDQSLTNDDKNALSNGPEVGGSKLESGVYNVPILVRFHV